VLVINCACAGNEEHSQNFRGTNYLGGPWIPRRVDVLIESMTTQQASEGAARITVAEFVKRPTSDGGTSGEDDGGCWMKVDRSRSRTEKSPNQWMASRLANPYLHSENSVESTTTSVEGSNETTTTTSTSTITATTTTTASTKSYSKSRNIKKVKGKESVIVNDSNHDDKSTDESSNSLEDRFRCYELVGIVSSISCQNESHLVTHITEKASRSVAPMTEEGNHHNNKGDDDNDDDSTVDLENGWVLFNDFVVKKCSESEALDFSRLYREPCTLLYRDTTNVDNFSSAMTLNETSPVSTSSPSLMSPTAALSLVSLSPRNVSISPAVFDMPSLSILNSRYKRKVAPVPSSPGSIVAMDTEFVSVAEGEEVHKHTHIRAMGRDIHPLLKTFFFFFFFFISK
jgi:hypothetical protein